GRDGQSGDSRLFPAHGADRAARYRLRDDLPVDDAGQSHRGADRRPPRDIRGWMNRPPVGASRSSQSPASRWRFSPATARSSGPRAAAASPSAASSPRKPQEAVMIDRSHVEKAAAAGAAKIELLLGDPARYLLRSVGAGMGLTLVVFVFWVLKQNLHDMSLGPVIAAAFFGVGLTIIVFTNTELFTSNNMYLAVSSAEGRTGWRHAVLLWILCYFGNFAGAIFVALLLAGAGSLALPPDHALFDGALHKAQQAGSVIFFKGILANWVVCLAVRMALRC